MIYVLSEPKGYFYEIYEMISIYYPGEKVQEMNEGEHIPEGTMLIKVIISQKPDMVAVDSIMCKQTEHGCEEIISISENSTIDANWKKSIKHCVKLSVFKLLKSHTGIEIPWGILVGIRPTKIVNELKSEGLSENVIYDTLSNKYMLRKDKIKLCRNVSNNSYDVINKDPKKISVYIGIPFCPTRCIYCSFASYPVSKYKDYIKDYMEALQYEIKRCADFIKGRFSVETIYIGGGTPTALDAPYFRKLLETVSNSFALQCVREYTIEAGRPDTIDYDKLSMMKEHGVGRISINPQSMNDDTLKGVGRSHSVNDIVEKFQMARSVGFNNINMDMILGMPNEGMEHVQNTLNKILELSPENITVHTLAVKRASRLHEKLAENIMVPVPERYLVEKMMDYTAEILDRSHYIPYYMYRQKMMVGNLENVGYCKEGFECLYNIQMIEEKETILAFGADGVTKTVFLDENRIERVANKKDLSGYIKTIEKNTDKKIEALKKLL